MDLNSEHFDHLQSIDFESQRVIATLNAEEERASSDGSQQMQGRKRKLIQVDDDEVDSDIEITPAPRQRNQVVEEVNDVRNKASAASKLKKPMFQATIDGGKGRASKLNKRDTTSTDSQEVNDETNNIPERRKRSRAEVAKNKKKCFRVIQVNRVRRRNKLF